jgi:peroxiredoxin
MRVAVSFLRFIVASVSLLFVCACSVADDLPTYAESTIVGEGDLMPNFEVVLTDGTTLDSRDYIGEPLLLILFSPACPDCKMLLDEVQQLIDADLSLPQLLVVGRDATDDDIVAYADENGYTMPMAPDAQRRVFSLFATTYVPRTYLIGRDGVVEMLAIEYDPSYIPALLERAALL